MSWEAQQEEKQEEGIAKKEKRRVSPAPAMSITQTNVARRTITA